MKIELPFKKRELGIILITLLILSSFLLINKILFNNKAYGSNRSYIMVYIKEEDSLLDLAIKYNTSDRDNRQLVEEIRQINNLGYKYIQAGDLIKIPIN